MKQKEIALAQARKGGKKQAKALSEALKKMKK